ncbi:MAG: SMC-Scp complex subunit ScpB [Gemmatimonadales bacterium]
MNPLTRLLEAALFAASRPLPVAELQRLDSGVEEAAVRAALDELKLVYDEGRHGVLLTEVAEGWQILTRPELADAIAQAQIVDRPRKLSMAAMETLAIIAYRQPVGRAEVEEIRGVASDGVLRMLQDRGLIEVTGRGEGLGRPLLYGTTSLFLEILGLRVLDDLPRGEELKVALTPVKLDTSEETTEGSEGIESEAVAG